MEKKTKQGIRDLNNIGNKKNLNGRRDKGAKDCFHIWMSCIDTDFVSFKKCERCGIEE